MNRTIAAISTPPGTGGIAVIRISGGQAIEIADKIFKGKDKLSEAPSHTVHYGFIVSEGQKLDEVLVSVMRAPRTFTTEDTVEINTHGGIVTVHKVLDAVIKAGADTAEPGEFTKRAFLNGRIDLSQAEAVIDVINSNNELSRKNALSQLEGALSKEISDVRGELLRLAASMQVLIDYPDEDLEDITVDDIQNTVTGCAKKIKALLDTADSGKVLRDGIKTAIAGKPNVGKSSLLNTLSRTDRAIVTDIAGTTRDVIEEYINLNGVPIVLTDTAGIRETDDEVERLGVERSRKSIEEADLVLVLLDGSDEITDEDIEVLDRTEGKKRIIVINKTDLGKPKYTDAIRERAKGDMTIEVSVLNGSGINEITDEIKRIYKFGEIEQSSGAVITNVRHKKALAVAMEALNRSVAALQDGLPTDICSIDINEAIRSLGEITGETVSDDIVKEIFHNFCVGK